MPKLNTVKKKNSKKIITSQDSRKSFNFRKVAPLLKTVNNKRASFLLRRPHRSFRRTMRRDYVRSLKLPGYIAFTHYVTKTVLAQKWIFIRLSLLFTILSIVLVGIASQSNVLELTTGFNNLGKQLFDGGLSQVSQAGLLLLAGLNGSLNDGITEVQQVYAGFIIVVLWLTTVWLLRAQLAGRKPNMRDALYASGSPIIPTFLLFLLLLVQFLPAAAAGLIYGAAYSSQLLENPLLSLVIISGGILLIVLSLYLVTSTFIALIAVTLPGMYPWSALRAAGDLVTGRRLRILYRILWCFFIVLIVWGVIMIPFIVFVSFLQQSVTAINWIPIIPAAFVLASTFSTIYISAYIYLLYRKVVDDDASPA